MPRTPAGGDTSVTDFFRQKTSGELAGSSAIVGRITTNGSSDATTPSVEVAKSGLVSAERAPEGYVTQRALDGLFLMIGEEEKPSAAIRSAPAAPFWQSVWRHALTAKPPRGDILLRCRKFRRSRQEVRRFFCSMLLNSQARREPLVARDSAELAVFRMTALTTY
jgi:hypothetical protein